MESELTASRPTPTDLWIAVPTWVACRLFSGSICTRMLLPEVFTTGASAAAKPVPTTASRTLTTFSWVA